MISEGGHFYDCRELVRAARYDVANEAHSLTDFYEKALDGKI